MHPLTGPVCRHQVASQRRSCELHDTAAYLPDVHLPADCHVLNILHSLLATHACPDPQTSLPFQLQQYSSLHDICVFMYVYMHVWVIPYLKLHGRNLLDLVPI